MENKEKNVVKYRKGGKIQHEHTCGTRSPVLCLNLSRGQEATQITLTIPYNATLHLHIGKLFSLPLIIPYNATLHLHKQAYFCFY